MATASCTETILLPTSQPESSAKTIRTVVVDDVQGYLDIEEHLLRFESLMEVVGRSSDSVDALELIAKLKPDLILIHIGERPFRHLSLVRTARMFYPALSIIAISHEDCTRLERICQTSKNFEFIHKADFRNAFEQVLMSAFLTRFQLTPPKSIGCSSATLRFDNNRNV